MANEPTTPGSVASRLTDGRIMDIAESCEYHNEPLTAEILRDYVRLRGIVKAVEEAIVGFDDYEYKKIKRLLAEAEKGERK